MGIEELNDSLHKREGEIREMHPPSMYDPTQPTNDADDLVGRITEWKDTSKESFFVRYRKSIRRGMFALGAIAVFVLVLGSFFSIRASFFADDRVEISVSGPDNVNSSDLERFVISYRNTNRSELKNARLIVSYPSGFRPEGNINTFRSDAGRSTIEIGDVAGFASGKVDFSGKFYGSKDSVASIRAELRYSVGKLSGEFLTIGEKSVHIRSSSLVVEIEAPLTVQPQGEVNYLVQYENTGDVDIRNVRLKAEYPEGFSFTGANPAPAEGDTVWYLGSIAPKSRGTINITGMLDGVPKQEKTIGVSLGTFQGDGSFFAYGTSERSTGIVAPPFRLTQEVNGGSTTAVIPGETLEYSIRYANNESVGLREVIIRVEVEGAALDFSKLRSEGGAYDSKTRMITWKASDVPSLASLSPGASGTVKFSVPVRDDLLPSSLADKNFRIRTVATAESPDVPNPAGANKTVATNTLWLKVNSRIFLESFGYHHDNTLGSEGSVPPMVGKDTTYTLRWRLSNTTNDITETKVQAFLPTGAHWVGKSYPDSEHIEYNERTNEIVWSVGSMKVGEGSLSSPREVSFRVSIRPESNQIGTDAPLLGGSTVVARDSYTNESLRFETSPKTTALQEDATLSATDYKVVVNE